MHYIPDSTLYMHQLLLVSQFVCDGEGERQSRVLADATAPVGLTHARHVGQPQRLARRVDGRTDVLSVNERYRVNRLKDSPLYVNPSEKGWLKC